MKYVVFTDLDGTLLDGRDYSFDAAREALELIRSKSVPLVIVTSKTRAEVLEIRERLGCARPFMADPFITENGGGIFIPVGYFPFDVGKKSGGGEVTGAEVTGNEASGGYDLITLGAPYEEVCRGLREAAREAGVKVRGFADMTAGEVAELSGFSIEDAVRAKERDFDEPFVIGDDGGGEGGDDGENDGDGEAPGCLLDAINARGYGWTRGRLWHILKGHDKGRAVRILKGFFTDLYGKITTVGIGDAANDRAMLEEVDIPVLVKREDGGHEEMEIAGLLRTDDIGPAGWNEAILDILKG